MPKPKWREIDFGPYSKIRPLEHTGHTITQVSNFLYFLGGVVSRRRVQLKEFYILDIHAHRWSSLMVPQGLDERPHFSLFGHTATLMDDRIIFIGGILGLEGRDYSDLIFSLDLASKEFSLVETFGSSKRGPIAFHSADMVSRKEDIIVYGGTQPNRDLDLHPLFALNARSMKWRKLFWKGQLPPSRSSHGTCLVEDSLYIFGGVRADFAVLNDTHVLCLANSVPTFSEVKISTPPEKRFATVLFYFRGQIFMYGGKKQYYEGPNIRLTDMHRFDLREQKWHECLEWRASELPLPRCNHKGVPLGNKILLFGGTNKSIRTALALSFY